MPENITITSPEIALIFVASELTTAWIANQKVSNSDSIANTFINIYKGIATIDIIHEVPSIGV